MHRGRCDANTSPLSLSGPILPGVTLPRAQLRWIVASLCLALLLIRVSGVHLHLCLDGSEPPVSYHVADSGVHHQDEHGAGESHSDRDMPVAKDAVVKKSSAASDALLLLVALALLLFLLPPSRQRRLAALPAAPPRRGFVWLRPPLRGPPSLA